ncbi:MAG: MFS transporter [Desulfobulbaceae bacterium]|nr:MFS transporter [Desulfobulbaceae bacterium]HIJ77862.1 MFS transporter [Deltaproteobacteria bacterium]
MEIKTRSPNKQLPDFIWTFTTYFSEGFPYTVIRTISSVFFRDRGVSLEAIGLTSLFGLPWVIKFLWGPYLDEFGTKRKWLLIMQAILVALITATAFLSPLTWAIPAIAAIFFLSSFVAATHDIAIDGFYMEALDQNNQAKYVGYRVMAYRIAMMTGTGIIVTLGTTIGWFQAFAAAALIMAALFLFHLYFLPRCETEKNNIRHWLKSNSKTKFSLYCLGAALTVTGIRFFLASNLWLNLQHTQPLLAKINLSSAIGILLFASLLLTALFRKRIKGWILREPDDFYAKAFLSFMDRKKIGAILAFIILIRTGEFMLSAMVAPFMVDLGIKVHYGWISGGIGLPCSIVGAMFGGWLIARYSLKKMSFPFLLAQNLTNIVYMFLALFLARLININTGNLDPISIGADNIILVALVHGFDQFAGGLGTAVLMTYLMRICNQEFKAAHYAIGTGLMSVSGLYAGVMSGFLASWIGYGYFFGISFLMSIPGMIMLFYIPFFDPPAKY